MGAGRTAIGPVRKALRDVSLREPSALRDYLLDGPMSQGGRLWCDRVIEGVDAGRRDCLRLYAEAMGWVGAHGTLALVFMNQFGVSNEAELARLVESGRKLERLAGDEDKALEDYRDSALDLLSAVLRRRPEWREMVSERVGSFASVVQEGAEDRAASTNDSVLVSEVTNGNERRS